MITDRLYAWRYIGLPRTGSTLLHRILQGPPLNGVYSGHQHDGAPLPYRKVLGCIPNLFAKQRLIASIRNPFTRNVSLWRHHRYQLGLKRWGRFEADGKVRPISEEEYPFGEFLLRRDLCDDPFYRYSQRDWVRHLNVTDYIRQETLWQDVQRLFPELAEQQAPEKENTSAAAIMLNFPYDDRWCISKVQHLDDEDFKVYGYGRKIEDAYDVA